MEIRIFNDPKEIALHSDQCRKQKLYVKGWMMRRRYCEPHSLKLLAQLIIDGELVGAAIITNWNTFQVYIKPNHRRKGHGTAMINAMQNYLKADYEIRASLGINGSYEFWKKNNFICC